MIDQLMITVPESVSVTVRFDISTEHCNITHLKLQFVTAVTKNQFFWHGCILTFLQFIWNKTVFVCDSVLLFYWHNYARAQLHKPDMWVLTKYWPLDKPYNPCQNILNVYLCLFDDTAIKMHSIHINFYFVYLPYLIITSWSPKY